MDLFSEEAFNVHYNDIYGGYVNKLNQLENQYPEMVNYSLEYIFVNKPFDSLFWGNFLRNGGGYYNHSLFFNNITPEETSPSLKMSFAINNAFGSFTLLKKYLKRALIENFGSGWTFLTIDVYRNLKIVNTKEHLNPLIKKEIPLLALDGFEHAYFLDYKANKKEYANALIDFISWTQVSRRFENIDLSIIA